MKLTNEMRDILHGYMSSTTKRDKEIVRLYINHELPCKDIGDLYGLSADGVVDTVRRYYREMRKYVMASKLSDEDKVVLAGVCKIHRKKGSSDKQ